MPILQFPFGPVRPQNLKIPPSFQEFGQGLGTVALNFGMRLLRVEECSQAWAVACVGWQGGIAHPSGCHMGCERPKIPVHGPFELPRPSPRDQVSERCTDFNHQAGELKSRPTVIAELHSSGHPHSMPKHLGNNRDEGDNRNTSSQQHARHLTRHILSLTMKPATLK